MKDTKLKFEDIAEEIVKSFGEEYFPKKLLEIQYLKALKTPTNQMSVILMMIVKLTILKKKKTTKKLTWCAATTGASLSLESAWKILIAL